MRNLRHGFYVFIKGKADQATFDFSTRDAGCTDTLLPLN